MSGGDLETIGHFLIPLEKYSGFSGPNDHHVSAPKAFLLPTFLFLLR
jgi:hypothetical protein